MWVAQCLTYDIAAQSSSFEGMIDSFTAVARRYAEMAVARGKEPFEDFKEAPQRFREMYDEHPRYRVRFRIEIPWPNHASKAKQALLAIAS